MKAVPAPASSEALEPADAQLYEKAREASNHAYAPYSRFRVGAAVRTARGAVYTGCNVENASYGLTICAERSAVFAAVAAEGPDMQIRDIAVHAEAHTPSPCGACRQVLAEFGRDARVLFPMRGKITVATVEKLLPVPFELELE